MGQHKVPLLSLPVSRSLPQHLTPDSNITDAASLFKLCDFSAKEGQSMPSMLRRSRQVQNAHFSYVTPLPTEFPYQVSDKLAEELVEPGQDGIDVETLLSKIEPNTQEPEFAKENALNGYTSNIRRKLLSEARLVGISQKCVADVLPSLDIGNAASYSASEEASEPVKQLTEILSGRAVLTNADRSLAPWSLCYAGHQFGSFAGQLGDGRAISILTTPAPPMKFQHNRHNPSQIELQLKGAGRTPYSRFADGLAVLRSSVREYLGSEAMAALSIPTSRALSLIHLPNLEVIRERRESGAVVCRAAPSWLRIGSFELLQWRGNWDALLKLIRYSASEVFGYDLQQHGHEAARLVLKEVAVRNAYMVAGWQVYGFMHGVMNTDNISILGLTIDYGPYAFMDVFSFGHICNHSDDMGRYAYRSQPAMIEYAIRKLGVALGEAIGAELEHDKPLQDGWAENATSDKRREWVKSSAAVIDEAVADFEAAFKAEYNRLFALRLGIRDAQESDQSEYFDSFLSLLNTYELDFTNSFRTLCLFPGIDSPHLDQFLNRLVPQDRIPKHLIEEAKPAWKEWLAKYAARLPQGESVEERTSRMQAVNPRFTLRQWILEETIKRLEDSQDVAHLQRVLDMATSPFKSYGEPALNEEESQACPDKQTQEAQRLCSIGSDSMLGFQCSCSS